MMTNGAHDTGKRSALRPRQVGPVARRSGGKSMKSNLRQIHTTDGNEEPSLTRDSECRLRRDRL